MTVSTTGANDTLVQHYLGEVIAGGVTIHLVSAAQAYTDGGTAVSADSEVSQAVAEADLTLNSATGFNDTATITNDNELNIDVSGITSTTTIVELVIQNQTNTDRFVLADETNDPDIGSIDTYTIPAGTVLYEFGNPT